MTGKRIALSTTVVGMLVIGAAALTLKEWALEKWNQRKIDRIMARVRESYSGKEEVIYIYYGDRDLEALVELGKPAIPALIKLLSEKDHNLRQFAFDAFENIGSHSIPSLIPLLEEGTGEGVNATLQLLGTFGPTAKPAVPAIAAQLKAKEFNTRSFAIRALVDIGSGATEAVPALIETLQGDKDFDAREMALSALERIAPRQEDLVPAFTAALQDEHHLNRVRTAAALMRIAPGNHDGILALIRALKDQEERWYPEELHREAARALGELGPRANEAISELTKALEDKDGSVSAAAAEAMRKIQG